MALFCENRKVQADEKNPNFSEILLPQKNIFPLFWR